MTGRARGPFLAFTIGLVLITLGATLVDFSSLSRTGFTFAKSENQSFAQPEWQKLKMPITFELELWYANGTSLKAATIIRRYTGTGGPVYGINANEPIPLTPGTQLLWGGRVYDSNGAPVALATIGLLYFPVRNGCDETQTSPISCFTTPTLVHRTKTDREGRFGYGSKLQPQSHVLYSWNVPQLAAGKSDIILYADFSYPILEERVKKHYAVKVVGQSVIEDFWINGQTVIEKNGELKDRVSVSNPVTIDFRTSASASMALFLAVGRCGNRGCFDTPPLRAMLMQELTVDPRTKEGSFTREYDPTLYMFYLLKDRVDPFTEGSAPRADSVLVFGIFDTSPRIEYRLFGITVLVGGIAIIAATLYNLLNGRNLLTRRRFTSSLH